MRYTTQSVLPYTQEQIFDLVANVERYAEFVPWWAAAKAYREGDMVYVEQALSLGTLLQYQFSSKAAIQRPVGVHITSNDGPFSHLNIRWHVQPRAQGGCLVTFSTDFQLRSSILQKLFETVFPQQAWWLFVKIFENRAHQLYGGRESL